MQYISSLVQVFQRVLRLPVVMAFLLALFVLATVNDLHARINPNTVGEYSDRISANDSRVREVPSDIVDDAGTRHNLVQDINDKQAVRTSTVGYNDDVTLSSATTWTQLPSTGSITSNRKRVIVSNSFANTQRQLISVAPLYNGTLLQPATNQHTWSVTPGNTLDIFVDENVAVIGRSTGTINTEKAHITELK